VTDGRLAPRLSFGMSAESNAQTQTPYELVGGDAGVRRLVDRFYDLMDSAP